MRSFLKLAICSLCLVGSSYISANGLTAFKAGDYDRAFRIWYMELSENPTKAEANFGLGQIILEGLGSTKANKKEGLNYLTKAIEQGSKDSALYLANAYKDSDIFEKNSRAELQYLEKAEQLGANGISKRIASLIKKLDGAVSAKACKTYNKKDRKSAYVIAQCIEKGLLDGRASDFYKVAFREGNNEAYLKAAKTLLNPVSPEADLKFMAQYLLDFLRKADKNQKKILHNSINTNGLSAAKCGLNVVEEKSNTSRGFGSRNSNRDSSSRGFGSSRKSESNRGFGSRDSSSGRDSSENTSSADLNIPMCILAAEAGDADAQVAAAEWFSSGQYGLPIDQKYSEALLARAAENGGSDTARAKLLETLWASEKYDDRLSQIESLISDPENERLVGETLVLEADYLLELIDQGRIDEAPQILTNEGSLALIFENVSVDRITPRLRLIFFGERESLSRVAQANAESIDFGARDLQDAFVELYQEREKYFREVAESALFYAAEQGVCEVLAFVEEEKRTFDDFSDELIKKFGSDCLLRTPDEAINIAVERIKDEDYPGAATYLTPLLNDESCNALEIAIRNKTKSRTISNLVDDFSPMLATCESNPVIALESLSRDMDSQDRQALFNKADDLCLERSVIGACSIAADMLVDRANKLDQQTAKTSFNAPAISDLRRSAIEIYLLPAAKDGDAKSALAIIEMTLISKINGTAYFKKDAESLIERLSSDRNPNGTVLKLVNELKIENPVDLLNNLGNSITGTTGRKCDELSAYRQEPNLEEFVIKEMDAVLNGASCGTRTR